MNERVAAWSDAGVRHRLWFSETDTYEGASLPFALCRRGDTVVATNVLCGVVDGREVRLFDLEVRVDDPRPDLLGGLPTTGTVAGMVVNLLDGPDVEGQEQFTTERWICAVVRAGAECWRMSVGPEDLLTALDDVVTLGDQNLEIAAFNEAFEVRADDRKFANDLLDQRMIEFLLAHMVGGVVETVGNRILVARRQDDVPDVDGILAVALGIADRVPNAVRSLYPGFPVGELTPGCPVGPDGSFREAHLVEPVDEDPWIRDPGGWAPPLADDGPG